MTGGRKGRGMEGREGMVSNGRGERRGVMRGYDGRRGESCALS